MRQGEKLRERARELLGASDELYEMLDRQLTLDGKNISTVGSIIARGMEMEDWQAGGAGQKPAGRMHSSGKEEEDSEVMQGKF